MVARPGCRWVADCPRLPFAASRLAGQRRIAVKTFAVAPEIRTNSLLAGAQFVDAYRLVVADPALDALVAARRVMGRTPRWIGILMALRNRAVAPLGLKAPEAAPAGSAARIGIFPVLSQSRDRVVLGLEDRHLDFRVIVDVAPIGDLRRVTVTTMVRTHNPLGRVYLAIVLPFHRIIVRALLLQASKA
jgi:hypothetical protein